MNITQKELFAMEISGGVQADRNSKLGKDVLELSVRIPTKKVQEALCLRPVISFCNYVDVELFRNIILN